MYYLIIRLALCLFVRSYCTVLADKDRQRHTTDIKGDAKRVSSENVREKETEVDLIAYYGMF